MQSPWRMAGFLIMVAMVIMTGSCTAERPVAVLPTPDTYRPEDPVGEDSVARAVPAGTATTLTDPLVARGAVCVQTRSNAAGRAIWCRHRDADQPWSAQFLITVEDELAWAWIPIPPPLEDSGGYADERWRQLAVATFGALWPDSSERADGEIERFEGELRERAERGIATEGAFTRSWRDDHADWTASSTDGLIVAGRGVELQPWPSDAGHYAGRMSFAVGDLQDSGYECFYPPQVYCRKEFSEFRVSLRGDRIITADFTIKGGETLADTFPRGLTFLSSTVRSAIAERIEQSRRDRDDYLGVVAGTVLAIDAAPVPPVGGPVPVAVRIGAPLAGTFPL